MGLPTNSSKAKSQGCSPVSSNCVIWQGPDLDCIGLCKGDTVSDVIAKMAEELCALLAMFDLEEYDLGCLLDDAPGNIKELLELIIVRVCALEGIEPGEGTVAGCPDCTVNIAECFYFTNTTGDTVTTMNLVDYVRAIGAKVCENVAAIATLQQDVLDLAGRIEALETLAEQLTNEKVEKSALDYVNDPSLDVTESPKFVTEAIRTVEDAFVTQRNAVGVVSELYKAMMKGASLNEEPSLSEAYLMKSLPGWVETMSSLADSINNMWVAMGDTRAAIQYIQENYRLGGCGDIFYNYRTILDPGAGSPTLTIFLDGSLGLDAFRDSDPAGATFKITDSDGNTTSSKLSIIDTVNDPLGLVYPLLATSIDITKDLTIELFASVYNPVTETSCEKVLTSLIVNIAACPAVTAVPTINSIEYSFPSTVDYTYIVELYEAGGITPIQTQNIPKPDPTVNGTFIGLTQDADFEVKVIPINGEGVPTDTCARVPVSTLADDCITPTGVSTVINLP